MKRLIKLVLFCTILGYTFNACTSSVDELFDDSAANRVTKAINEYKEVLVAAKNGWLMEYYAEGNGKDKMGGINMFITFNDNGRAVIFSDSPVTDIISKTTYPAGTKVESAYEVLADQIVMLTFNSHNPIIHYYSEPSSSDVNGYEGDYEFLFRQVSKDEIILTGKKIGLTIRMTAIPEDVDSKKMLKDISDIKTASSILPFNIYLDGDSIGYINNLSGTNNNMFEMVVGDVSVRENFVTTTTGIKFYKPILIQGQEFDSMSWNLENVTFSSNNTQKNISFTQVVPEGFKSYSYYLGEYVMNHSSGSVNITIEEDIKYASYKIIGLFKDIDPTFLYNKGRMEFKTHSIISYNEEKDICLIPWSSVDGYIHSGTEVGGFFAADSKVDGKFNFEDNGVWGNRKTDGFMLYLISKAGVRDKSYTETTPNRYAGPISIIKK